MTNLNRTGVIGGSGLYALEGLEILEKRKVETPFGPPSAPLAIGKMGKQEVVFLPRHGESHELLPSEINYRANIWALKEMGAGQIISVSAVGSLQKEIAPGNLVIPNQYFDWTRGKREASFFGKGLTGHISSAEPACPELTRLLLDSARRADVPIQKGKVYACVEGPRLGTRAESFFLKNAGCDLVGMTNVPECFLALEAQVSYNTIAVVTDYDCWLDDPSEHVTVEAVVERYKKTLSKVLRLMESFFGQETISIPRRMGTGKALMAHEESLSKENRRVFDFLIQ